VIYDYGVTLAETWRALERLVDDGQCKAIGLSDVTLEKLREVVAAARIKPAVVQVESHPYLPEWDLLEFCRGQGIVLLAFAALGHGLNPRVVDDPVITSIAQRVHKTPAQVALAWAVQRGAAFLTTSTKRSYIQENFEIRGGGDGRAWLYSPSQLNRTQRRGVAFGRVHIHVAGHRRSGPCTSA
jgi:diketogulonate reductase-like aldo/keto reductase